MPNIARKQTNLILGSADGDFSKSTSLVNRNDIHEIGVDFYVHIIF